MNPLVSIVVAAYNAEKTLSKCIDSLLMQTYKNIEILIVDDASTDATWCIMQDYAQHDSRIKTLRMERNGGAPAARNMAYGMMKGKFYTLVDSDDWLSLDAISSAVSMMEEDEELDITLFSLHLVDENGGNERLFRIGKNVPRRTLTGKEACYWSLQWNIPGLGLCRNIPSIRIEEEELYGQYGDETSTHIQFLNSRKVGFSKGIYYYYQNPNSVTKAFSIKRFEILECRTSLRNHLLKAKLDKRFIRRLDEKRWREMIGACFLYYHNAEKLTNEERKQVFQRIKSVYDSISVSDLNWTTTLKPRFMMMPTFRLFYWQLAIVFKLKLMRV